MEALPLVLVVVVVERVVGMVLVLGAAEDENRLAHVAGGPGEGTDTATVGGVIVLSDLITGERSEADVEDLTGLSTTWTLGWCLDTGDVVVVIDRGVDRFIFTGDKGVEVGDVEGVTEITGITTTEGEEVAGIAIASSIAIRGETAPATDITEAEADVDGDDTRVVLGSTITVAEDVVVVISHGLRMVSVITIPPLLLVLLVDTAARYDGVSNNRNASFKT